MKNGIKLLIVICILIIIVVIITILLLQGNIQKQDPEDEIQDDLVEVKNGSEQVKNREDYYIASSCVDTYLSYITTKDKKEIYNILDTKYKQEYSITEENVLEFVEQINESQVFKATQMYVRQEDANILNFYIVAKIREENELERKPEQEYRIIVRMNTQERTFSILPYSYIKEKNIQKIEQLEEKYIKNTDIIKSESNQYINISIDDKIMANLYFMDYKDKVLYDVQEAYNQLEDKYRIERFQGIENYKKYVAGTSKELEQLTVTSYLINEYENYTEYVCKDKFDNLYIFRETAPMQYTITLDTYTLEQTKFKEEYAKANTQKKVMMNIDKFMQMINAKDYTTSYKLLSESFKDKNFKTQQDYEKYIQQHMFRYNEVSYDTFNTYNDVYSYKLVLKDKTKQSQETKSWNITMKLGEGTNFEISFEV